MLACYLPLLPIGDIGDVIYYFVYRYVGNFAVKLPRERYMFL